MRYINIRTLEDRLPGAWIDEAATALAAVREAGPDRRSAEIEKYDHLWRQLAGTLAEISSDKCWYCETRFVRDDLSVDHFRPKGKIYEAPEREGYWWLAFDWSNLRLSCTYCNERRVDKEGGTAGGKRTHFPLLPGSPRAEPEQAPTMEFPELLDPTRGPDPRLLVFSIDGGVAPRHPASAGDLGYRHPRARTSIRVFHLDHQRLVRARKRLYQLLRRNVRTGQRCVLNLAPGNETAVEGYNDVVCDLLELTAPEAEHSAAAVDMLRLMSQKPANEWLANVL